MGLWSTLRKYQLLSQRYRQKYPKGFPIVTVTKLSRLASGIRNVSDSEFTSHVKGITNDSQLVSITAASLLSSPASQEEGIRLLKVAAEMGDLDSRYRFATILRNGEFGQKVNVPKSNQIFQELLRLQHPNVHFFESQELLRKKRFKEATKHLEIAANTKDDSSSSIKVKSASSTILGLMYIFGEHIPKDLRKGLHYLQQGTDLGHPEATGFLGRALLVGDLGMEPDVERALRLLKTAAENGDCLSQHHLGYIYLYGKYGVEKDIDFAIEYWKMAGEQGDAHALFELGELCFKGYKGGRWNIPKDLELARTFYERLLKLHQFDKKFAAMTRKAQKILNELPAVQTVRITKRTPTQIL
jgi:TPR repeat protein